MGDNLFYGQGFSALLKKSSSLIEGAIIYSYAVSDPKRFGIVEFDKDLKVKSIKEKPSNPKSNYAVTGIYFYDNKVINYAKNLKPSGRGELEITSINKIYLKKNNLKVEILGRGLAWLDTGTAKSLLNAGQFVQTIEDRQGFKIACLEEIAYNNNWIDKKKIIYLAKSHKNVSDSQYLLNILKNK